MWKKGEKNKRIVSAILSWNILKSLNIKKKITKQKQKKKKRTKTDENKNSIKIIFQILWLFSIEKMVYVVIGDHRF